MKITRPVLKQYTLIRFEKGKEVSRELVWIDEARIFPKKREDSMEEITEEKCYD